MNLNKRDQSRANKDLVGGEVKEDAKSRNYMIFSGQLAVQSVGHRSGYKQHGSYEIGDWLIEQNQHNQWDRGKQPA
jgi:hypothetical protein